MEFSVFCRKALQWPLQKFMKKYIGLYNLLAQGFPTLGKCIPKDTFSSLKGYI